MCRIWYTRCPTDEWCMVIAAHLWFILLSECYVSLVERNTTMSKTLVVFTWTTVGLWTERTLQVVNWSFVVRMICLNSHYGIESISSRCGINSDQYSLGNQFFYPCLHTNVQTLPYAVCPYLSVREYISCHLNLPSHPDCAEYLG